MASFSISRRGFAPVFFGPEAFFCFLALGTLGGVLERSELSWSEGSSDAEFSSSEVGLGRFLVGLSVVWDIFLGAAFEVAAFLGGRTAFFEAAFEAAGFALGFCGSQCCEKEGR